MSTFINPLKGCLVNRYFILIFLTAIQSYSYAQNFLKELTNIPLDSLKIDAFAHKIRSYQPTSMDSVLFYGEMGIQYFKDSKYHKGEGMLNVYMAQIHLFNGSLFEAEKHGKEAIRLAENHNLPHVLARGYDFMTAIYGSRGEFVKSTEFAYKALRANEKLQDQRGIISTYIKLSAISVELNNSKDAILFAKKADSLNKATLNDLDLSMGLKNNEALAYLQIDSIDKALEIFLSQETLIQNNSAIDYTQKPSVLVNIAKLYLNKRDFEKAKSYSIRGLEEAKKRNMPGITVKTMSILAQIYQAERNYLRSNEEALNALENSRNFGLKESEIELLELISINYRHLNDYKKSLEYAESHFQSVINFQDEKNENKIQQLESAYKLEKAEEELQIATHLSELRTKQRDISIFFFLLAIVFLAAFIYAYYKIRLLNKKNEQINNKLSETNEEKDKLFSIIGHDLRGAYLGTLGFLNLVKDNDIEKEDFPIMLNEVINQSKIALDTLDNLLMWGFNQINSGNKINIKEFDSQSVILQNMDFLTENIQKKKIKIENLIDRELSVKADENHFSFIVRNLLSNAIKFTPDHGQVTLGYQLQENGFCEYYVKDNGVGIEEDRLRNIFNSFSKSTYGTRKEKGSGLGLVLCREFVELNGGQIRVESKIGEGTTFYFSVQAA